jgi:hypothetical protein
MYYAQKFIKLSSVADIFQFTALKLHSRLRLGLSAVAARGIRKWQKLEKLTAEEWLLKLCGREVYRVV